MRIVFSRKGFDSAAGGAPSPIVDGRARSLPIPARGRSVTSYAALGLGDHVEAATRGRIPRGHLCHEDPMFFGGRCLFGQTGAAQSHLANQGVGPGDVFLFFGLFADPGSGARHHRIFGWMRVEQVLALGAEPEARAGESPRPHPHRIGAWNANNTLYAGPGATGAPASDPLRLTVPGGPLRRWRIPAWLETAGLSYHANPARWPGGGLLDSVSRGQEFVAHVGDAPAPRAWLDAILGEIAA